MAKRSALDYPLRISASLFCTRKLMKNNDEVFILERRCKVPEHCVNQMYIGERSLDQLRELYPVLKTTCEDTVDQTQKDFQLFKQQIAQHFEYRTPTYKEISLWYTDCDKICYQADRGLHDLKRELLMNFGGFLVKEVKQYIEKNPANKRWNFFD